jgi:hypothetical protein
MFQQNQPTIKNQVLTWSRDLTPSYTVDQTGRFIGWSPDSGAIAKPDQIHSENMAREKIDVDVFLMKLDH